MATLDPRRISDGFTTLEGGMDGGFNPSLLPPNQVPMAINATMRGGFIKPRPGQKKQPLTFPDVSGNDDTVLRAAFEDGKFQFAKAYRTSTGDDALVAAIDGRMYKIDLTNFTVQDITIPNSPNSSLLEQVWMEQAEEFLVMQDGVSAPYIFNGASARRATVGEIPTGTAMAYVMGRIWIASPNRRQFVASDLVYGPSGTSTYNYRDSVLKMSENDLLITGGAFSVPSNGGDITAITTVVSIDTATGQGPVMIFTRTLACSVNAPADRTLWKQVTYPIQTVSLINSGAVSQRAIAHVNSDIWYRSLDGIRSFVIAQRTVGLKSEDTWSNTPQSDEVRAILENDEEALLDRASSVAFDNRLLTTVSPVYTTHGVYFRGLVALDFSLISGIGRHFHPAWEGLWTGVNILQILKCTVNSVERCFLFVLDSNNKIVLWELTKKARCDQTSTPIVWSYESKSFKFADKGTDLKQLVTGQQWYDEVWGNVNFDLKFRPDKYPLWLDWTAWSVCANTEDCATPQCGLPQAGPKQYRLQYRTDTRFPRPPDTCDADIGRVFSRGFEFSIRQEITGYCRIKRLLLHAHEVDESPIGGCPVSETVCKSVTGCDLSPFTYDAEGEDDI